MCNLGNVRVNTIELKNWVKKGEKEAARAEADAAGV